MSDLFRREAIDHAAKRLDGEVVLVNVLPARALRVAEDAARLFKRDTVLARVRGRLVVISLEIIIDRHIRSTRRYSRCRGARGYRSGRQLWLLARHPIRHRLGL
jgi:hypothetical protein